MAEVNSENINVQDENGNTFLHECLITNCLRLIPGCLRDGANVNIPNKEGDTALILAARSGHHMVFMQIAVAGPDFNHRNNNGQSALDVAEELGHKKIASFLRRNLNTEPVNIYK